MKKLLLIGCLFIASLASAQSFTYIINGSGLCTILTAGGISCQNLPTNDGTGYVVGFTVNRNGYDGTFTMPDRTVYNVTWTENVLIDTKGKLKILYSSSTFGGGITSNQEVRLVTMKSYTVNNGITTVPITQPPPKH